MSTSPECYNKADASKLVWAFCNSVCTTLEAICEVSNFAASRMVFVGGSAFANLQQQQQQSDDSSTSDILDVDDTNLRSPWKPVTSVNNTVSTTVAKSLQNIKFDFSRALGASPMKGKREPSLLETVEETEEARLHDMWAGIRTAYGRYQESSEGGVSGLLSLLHCAFLKRLSVVMKRRLESELQTQDLPNGDVDFSLMVI